ncbi:MAG: cytochrome c biogenesis protein CcdA [Gallionella sp.]|nr:cytochrome c biogenesis protein CcdA [Gallionella sp.]
MSIGGGAALWGGFSSFFSIWQLCIMQVSPFFMAYIVGIYLATSGKYADPKIWQWILVPCITYAIGFTVLYSLLIASALDISRPLIHGISPLRVVSGIFFLLVGLYIILIDRIPFLAKMHRPFLISVLSLLIGAAFAIMYSPCITPMLSDIMGLASQRSTAVEGWYLAFFYGLGTTIALCLTAIALILFARKREAVMRNTVLIKNICAAILFILAAMNMAGLMRHYKAFVLGFVL